MTSQDKSIAGASQNWLNRGNAALGKPDDYDRRNSDTGIEFHNKSDMGGRANGPVTPNQGITGSVENFMQASDAEFGQQSDLNGRGASQQLFFENDQNP